MEGAKLGEPGYCNPNVEKIEVQFFPNAVSLSDSDVGRTARSHNNNSKTVYNVSRVLMF